jgi:hypothetical protein
MRLHRRIQRRLEMTGINFIKWWKVEGLRSPTLEKRVTVRNGGGLFIYCDVKEMLY